MASIPMWLQIPFVLIGAAALSGAALALLSKED